MELRSGRLCAGAERRAGAIPYRAAEDRSEASRSRAPDGSAGRIESSIAQVVTSASGMQRIDHGQKGTGLASGRIAEWRERWSRRCQKFYFRYGINLHLEKVLNRAVCFQDRKGLLGESHVSQ
jgi:hypothetical protein